MNILTTIRQKLAALQPSRVVAFLTPLVLVPAAGATSTWLALHFPGVSAHLDTGHLTAIFVTGAATAFGLAHKWLNGRAVHERAVLDAVVKHAERNNLNPLELLSLPGEIHTDDLRPDPSPPVDDLDNEEGKRAEQHRVEKHHRRK